MKGLQVIGLIFFSLLIIAGLMTANGVTGNIIASATAAQAAPQIPPIAGYIASFVGLAGFFVIIALNKKEEDYY